MSLQSKPVLRRVATAIATAAASLVVVAGTTQSAHADIHRVPQLSHGCPGYAVCFYPAGTGWNGDHPSFYYNFQSQKPAHYWSNFNDVYGTLRVYDNGYAQQSCYGFEFEDLSLNTGYNGGGSHRWLSPGHYIDAYLTPINSITLWHTYNTSGTCPE